MHSKFSSHDSLTQMLLLPFIMTALAMPALSIGRSLQLTAIAGRDMKSTVECWTFNQELMDIKGVRYMLLMVDLWLT